MTEFNIPADVPQVSDNPLTIEEITDQAAAFDPTQCSHCKVLRLALEVVAKFSADPDSRTIALHALENA